MRADDTDTHFHFDRTAHIAARFRGDFALFRRLRRFSALIPVVVFVSACWMLHHELVHHPFNEIREALWKTPATKLLAAVALTTCSYLILVICEFIAVRAAGCSLPVSQIASTSLVSYATSYNFGPLLGNTLMRFRLYPMFGLGADSILNIIIVSIATFWAGVCSVVTFVLLCPLIHGNSGATVLVRLCRCGR